MKLKLTPKEKRIYSSYLKQNMGTFIITHMFFRKSIRHYADYIYIYFRWLDDQIDNTKDKKKRLKIASEQKRFLSDIFRGKFQKGLCFQKRLMQAAARFRKSQDLKPFVMQMFRALEFDAERKGRLCSRAELMDYSKDIGYSYAKGVHYFSSGFPINKNPNHLTKAAFAAHLVHILRDLKEDIDEGFINIPKEELAAFRINLQNLDSYDFRSWVRYRLHRAQKIFRSSKKMAKRLKNRGERISFYIYCLRYEYVMKKIKKDDYILRRSYEKTFFDKFIFLMKVIGVTVQHSFR